MAIYEGMPEKKYRAMEGINQSSFKDLARSPAHYHYAQQHKPKPTSAMIVGSAFHARVLEPDRYAEEFMICDASTRTTKKYKEMAKDSEGADIILAAEAEQVEAMARAIEDSYAYDLIDTTHKEVSLDWDHDGIKCKARLDCVEPGQYIADVKTIVSGDRDTFTKQAADYLRHIQAAYYSDGWAANTGESLPFIFVCVEKDPPHCVSVYQFSAKAISLGREQYTRYLNMIRACRDYDIWHGYEEDIQVVDLPAWYTKKGN